MLNTLFVGMSFKSQWFLLTQFQSRNMLLVLMHSDRIQVYYMSSNMEYIFRK